MESGKGDGGKSTSTGGSGRGGSTGGSGGGDGMMKAPGGGGTYISRAEFESNPKPYFDELRGKKYLFPLPSRSSFPPVPPPPSRSSSPPVPPPLPFPLSSRSRRPLQSRSSAAQDQALGGRGGVSSAVRVPASRKFSLCRVAAWAEVGDDLQLRARLAPIEASGAQLVGLIKKETK
ncbi:hypothetical protein H6P81_013387 [Aristolochia fimbriata]|uniref:Uncharacterized protein n=1 Tax=Aristolochia fimbriata TaxID=158543 RepID=A0AAV7EEZ7_ARIFI|nr:hypothetical protein H6P81_013387 [Aristolochia fimbriata]